ncbi:MAG: AzlD domain-containing protein [Clostridia bacterium]|nr:AzlD domain-containing protein [Clostridia bacterium]
MNNTYLILGIAVMAIVTYLIRVTPMVLIRKKIKNKWIKSFLYYVPYTVLSAMTFPAVLYSTSSFVSAAAGSLVAIVLAYTKRSLLTVAVCAAFTAFIMQIIM